MTLKLTHQVLGQSAQKSSNIYDGHHNSNNNLHSHRGTNDRQHHRHSKTQNSSTNVQAVSSPGRKRTDSNSSANVLDTTDLSRSKTSLRSYSNQQNTSNSYNVLLKKRNADESDQTSRRSRESSSSRRASETRDNHEKGRSRSVSPSHSTASSIRRNAPSVQSQTPRSSRFSSSILNMRNRNLTRPKSPQLSELSNCLPFFLTQLDNHGNLILLTFSNQIRYFDSKVVPKMFGQIGS